MGRHYLTVYQSVQQTGDLEYFNKRSQQDQQLESRPHFVICRHLSHQKKNQLYIGSLEQQNIGQEYVLLALFIIIFQSTDFERIALLLSWKLKNNVKRSKNNFTWYFIRAIICLLEGNFNSLINGFESKKCCKIDHINYSIQQNWNLQGQPPFQCYNTQQRNNHLHHLMAKQLKNMLIQKIFYWRLSELRIMDYLDRQLLYINITQTLIKINRINTAIAAVPYQFLRFLKIHWSQINARNRQEDQQCSSCSSISFEIPLISNTQGDCFASLSQLPLFTANQSNEIQDFILNQFDKLLAQAEGNIQSQMDSKICLEIKNKGGQKKLYGDQDHGYNSYLTPFLQELKIPVVDGSFMIFNQSSAYIEPSFQDYQGHETFDLNINFLYQTTQKRQKPLVVEQVIIDPNDYNMGDCQQQDLTFQSSQDGLEISIKDMQLSSLILASEICQICLQSQSDQQSQETVKELQIDQSKIIVLQGSSFYCNN